MTVAFNLSQLANNVNSSGQLSLGTGITSTLPIANGGTASTTAAGARTNISAAGSGAVGSSSMTSARILGRTTASTGAIEEITVGSGLSLSAGALTATSTVDTNSVLTALAGLTANAVGTFAFLQNRGGTSYSFGDTAAGSNLYPSSNTQVYQFGALSGTWRCLGYCPEHTGGGDEPTTFYSSLFIRIS